MSPTFELPDITGKKWRLTLDQLTVTPDPPPPPPPPPLPSTTGGNVSTWYMIWPNSGRVRMQDYADIFDMFFLAFLNGGGPSLVGDSPYGLSGLQQDCAKVLEAKRRVGFSIGGGGYTTSLANQSTFLRRFEEEEKKLKTQITAINWDDETDSYDINAAVRITRQLKKDRGSSFYASWSPNGGHQSKYANVLVDNPDVVDELAFQNYDTVVSYQTAVQQVELFLMGKKLKPSQIGFGMMIQGDSQHWTFEQCVERSTQIKKDYGITKFNLWELSRAQTRDWAVAMNKLAHG